MPDPNVSLPPAPPTVEVVPGGPVSGSIRPPGSKSLTNRALVCAAFADAPSTLRGALRSEDTEVMIDSLAQIDVKVEITDGGRTLYVDPTKRIAAKHAGDLIEMFIANSGTTIRFLTAALSAAGGHYRLSGVPRMHERPIGDLTDAISAVIDGDISPQSDGGCPPVLIDTSGWSGNALKVGGNVSSQYLSGLMMAAPIAASKHQSKQVQISVVGELVSRPYVDMTAKVMRSFGSKVEIIDDRVIDDRVIGDSDQVVVQISDDPYHGIDYAIEPDASAASYFWAAAAITGGTVTVEGLSQSAMQGDVAFVNVLQQMGCEVQHGDDSITVIGKTLGGVDVDMNAISDTVQTLSVVALFASGPTTVRGVAHNRFKETDRIGDLATELRKLGAKVDEHDDGMTITPGNYQPATLETYHDHRMAMSLSLAGLKIPGVKILDPACTAKTYPDYFADLESLIQRPHRWA
ncbi:3-phosphoshikimate 1-carboxyvinyltransferase [Rubripirellula obstinata]|uniref:3-phosphoshikimate 1-carboxyvinyltransferase n=1 Tax=Rubripirellula obstinata TaxID=406547 RepID=A0A5B1CT56_9BACT|nr:3-phosphoshikimate 1-carboxyvinyltransferase [Rubripirellula obstinata]KAA1262404.1 3-phosphoshikimate 1-carboxyvinyltransferase [Rubripirellula obstinata]